MYGNLRFLCDVSMANLLIVDRGLKIVNDHIYTHTTYVGMGVVRKSSFLCDVSITKLFSLSNGLKIVTVQCT